MIRSLPYPRRPVRRRTSSCLPGETGAMNGVRPRSLPSMTLDWFGLTTAFFVLEIWPPCIFACLNFFANDFQSVVLLSVISALKLIRA